MFNFFKKKTDNFEFYTIIPGLEHAFPILPARQVKMPWVQQSQTQFKKILADSNNMPGIRAIASYMCSGISGIANTGWILTTWHDIEIITNGDLRTFLWNIPTLRRTLPFAHIGSFDADIFGDFAELPPETLKTLIKINTPWRVRAPKGWGLLMAPLQYHNETRFSSALGVLNPEIASNLDGVLFWHVINDRVVIPAGTPLCQLIPIQLDNVPDFVCRDATDQEISQLELELTIRQGSWTNSNNLAKKAYKSFWSKNEKS
jgi:hypothetical protein